MDTIFRERNHFDIRYPLQFVLGPRVPKGLEDWQRIPVGSSLILSAHPNLSTEQVSNSALSITLIGYLLDSTNPSASNLEILDSLSVALQSGEDLFELTCSFGGRWIIIVDDGSNIRLFGDTTGLRQLMYSDIQVSSEFWCASQSTHIADELGLEMDPKALGFIEWFRTRDQEYWWPGDSTPYREIKRLLPNHFLQLPSGEACRFWPDSNHSSSTMETATPGIAEELTNLMQAAVNRYDLAIAISAGWDSRLVLAACKPFSKSLSYYTSKGLDIPWSHRDIAIPIKLFAELKLPHDLIEDEAEISAEFAQSFYANVPFAKHARLIPLQQQLKFYKRQKVTAGGNVAAIIKCYYKSRPFDRRRPRPTARHHSDQKIDVEYLMLATGMHHPFAKTQYTKWLEGIQNTKGYQLLDIFYWEQRTGAWFAQSCLEFDSAWKEYFSPFNSRKLLTEMLAVDEKFRKPPHYKLYQHLMLSLWPEVMSQPINPN